MGFYDKIVNSIRNVSDIKGKLTVDPTTNESVSSALAAELTIISTLLISSLLLRHINIVLTIVVILGLGLISITNMPIIQKFKREQSDSLEKMTFYTILTLGILTTVIYWGTIHV